MADTHVHLHPHYDLGVAPASLCASLARHGKGGNAPALASFTSRPDRDSLPTDGPGARVDIVALCGQWDSIQIVRGLL